MSNLRKMLMEADQKVQVDDVFLGGTCCDSKWRDYLQELLKISSFNPVVENWNEEAQKEEIRQRENCKICLYVITPKMKGVYSIAEVVEDSIKRPEKTIFAYLEEDGDDKFDKFQIKSLEQVGKMVYNNGADYFGGEYESTLKDIADYINKKGL